MNHHQKCTLTHNAPNPNKQHNTNTTQHNTTQHKTPTKLPLLETAYKWARSAHTFLRGECASLARAAVAGPGPPDPAGAAALAAGLARVQAAYRAAAVSHGLVAFAALLAPVQAAALHVAAYPYAPLLAAVLEADAARAAAAAAAGAGGGSVDAAA